MDLLRESFIEPELAVDAEAFKPASYLRRVFQLDQDVIEAKLIVTACGRRTRSDRAGNIK